MFDVVANDRIYLTPKTCAIAICLDGCEPEYLDVAIAEGLMPNLKRIRAQPVDRALDARDRLFGGPDHRHGQDDERDGERLKLGGGQVVGDRSHGATPFRWRRNG